MNIRSFSIDPMNYLPILTNVNDQIKLSNIHLLFGHPKISLDYHLHMSLSDSGDFVALNATAIPGMDDFSFQ